MDISQFTSRPVTREALFAYISSFLDSLDGGRTQTRATYDCALREFVRWFDHDGRFMFAVADVHRYKGYLSAPKKLTPASISTYLNALRQLCEYLYQHEIISFNPAKYVRCYGRRKSDRLEALTKVEVSRLIDALDQADRRVARDSAILRLMVQYGLAETELVSLDVMDYLFIAGRGVLKLHRRRNEARVLLEHDMTVLMNGYLASRSNATDEQPLFLSDGNRTRGMRMTTRGIRARVNHYLGVAGIVNEGSRKITPLILKNTAAILMAEAGASVDEIKYRMRFGSLAKARKYVNQVALSARLS